jgi:hypothetical protein
MLKTSSAGYVYDEKSGAVLNTNTGELEQYMAARDKAIKDAELYNKIDLLEQRIIELENRLGRIDG